MNDQTLIKKEQTTATTIFQPTTFEQLERFAKYLAGSDFVPKDYKGKPANTLIAMQMGAEVGLKPMQSIQNIAVINGRPCLWGDALLAIVKARSDCEYVDETIDERNMVAACKVKRKNQPICQRTFSMIEAKKAGLAGRNVWTQYPKRMLQMRARAFALRDSFADALKGFSMAEEVQDYNKQEKSSFKELNKKPEFQEASSIYQAEEKTEKPADGLINAIQVQEISKLIQEHLVDVPSLFSYYKIESLTELSTEEYSEAIQLILKKPLKENSQAEDEVIANNTKLTTSKGTQAVAEGDSSR